MDKSAVSLTMPSLHDVLPAVSTLTFDCYGTLIDWRAGLGEALTRIFGDIVLANLDAWFDAYVEEEAQVEGEGYQSYRRILTLTVERLAKRFAIALPHGKESLLADLLPNWRPFADTNEALARLKKRFDLGVLSNIDRDLLTRTARQFTIEFDFVITAEDVRSYKPNPGHFERLLSGTIGRDCLLHIAQSPYHDGLPTSKLGIAWVWINRYNQDNNTGTKPLATFPDLRSLADAIEVPTAPSRGPLPAR